MKNPITLNIKTMAEWAASEKKPEILFWVGCSGSFDERSQRITKALALILQHVGISFAVLGMEESCTGDPAKRAGNEFLFQMQALNNIQILNGYEIKKIVTACPHCFNTLKNEYPDLGGNYEVIHHTVLIDQLIKNGKLVMNPEEVEVGRTKKITYHDPCYLGRGNNIYEAPREVIKSLYTDLSEMKRSRSKGLCCGAGGGQMFKEPEKGKKDINLERVEEALNLKPDIIAAACPFCMTMLRDGVKHFEKEDTVAVMDIAELTAKRVGLID